MVDLNTLVPSSQANLNYPATIDDLGIIGGFAMNQITDPLPLSSTSHVRLDR